MKILVLSVRVSQNIRNGLWHQRHGFTMLLNPGYKCPSRSVGAGVVGQISTLIHFNTPFSSCFTKQQKAERKRNQSHFNDFIIVTWNKTSIHLLLSYNWSVLRLCDHFIFDCTENHYWESNILMKVFGRNRINNVEYFVCHWWYLPL